MKFYVTSLYRNRSQVFIKYEYEKSYVSYTSSEAVSHIKQFIKYYFKMLLCEAERVQHVLPAVTFKTALC